jgi:hypothetical protein
MRLCHHRYEQRPRRCLFVGTLRPRQFAIMRQSSPIRHTLFVEKFRWNVVGVAAYRVPKLISIAVPNEESTAQKSKSLARWRNQITPNRRTLDFGTRWWIWSKTGGDACVKAPPPVRPQANPN